MIGNFSHPLTYLCYWCFNGSAGWTGYHHILRGVGSRTVIPNQPKLTTVTPQCPPPPIPQPPKPYFDKGRRPDPPPFHTPGGIQNPPHIPPSPTHPALQGFFLWSSELS
ncbi:unnamed protein product [Tuber melanosporum]|uniref:(Perigord truffle) hypothetical protein n=1 Tax=Tuber melanosporum (strain Mel28) TaxID=656061 RepID=D5G453_TUBMM|nr:uncharacterized protein GSTUM_00003955001 [Tuber melanosporum]CAZ79296.1 unnamed protein product [Tuber melanosporum]